MFLTRHLPARDLVAYWAAQLAGVGAPLGALACEFVRGERPQAPTLGAETGSSADASVGERRVEDALTG